MRTIGTAHLVEVMDAYDLLPVHNFQFGKHPDIDKIASTVWEKRFTQGILDGCWYGCPMACAKGADGHEVLTGPYKGHMVHGGRPRVRDVRRPRVQLRHLRPRLDPRVELLLRHLRHRHHLLRHHAARSSMECYAARHPEHGADAAAWT